MENANANSLQQSILQAVDTIVSRRVKDAEYDKTIIGTINSFVGIKNKKSTYKVNYNGGFFNAVVLNSEDSYIKNTPVYVFVPRGDFSQEKIILGRASNINTDLQLDISNAILNDFSIIGKNNLKWTFDKEAAGLRSYHDTVGETSETLKHRLLCLYDSESTNNYVDIDNFNNLKRYIEEGTAFMVRADFRTNLSIEQKQTAASRYGLIFELLFDNEKNQWGTTQGEILDTLCEKNIIKGQTDTAEEKTLTECINYIKELIDGLNTDNFNENIKSSDSNLVAAITEITALYMAFANNSPSENIDIVEDTIFAFLRELQTYFEYETVIDVQNSFYEWLNREVKTEEVKKATIQLNSDTMIGSPLHFKNWTSQHAIFKTDNLKFFKKINKIWFFKDGFISNETLDAKIAEDIFVKNIGFYVLKPVDSIVGDYSLKVEATDTGTILSSNSNEKVTFKAEFRRKLEDLSQSINLTYYWFKEDPSIISGNADFNQYGGQGWKLISGAKENSKYFSTIAEENESQKNNYKCVAVFTENSESTIIVAAPFIVYNIDKGHVVELESNQGTVFQFSLGFPAITCKVDGEEKTKIDIIEESEEGKLLKFYWSLIINNQEIPFFDQSETLNWNTLPIQDIVNYQGQDQYFKNVGFYRCGESLIDENGIVDTVQATQLRYPMINLNSDEKITIKCVVMKEVDFNEIFVGSAELDFENRGGILIEGYHIEFENDGQVFQYDEYGNSPKLNNKLDPLEILPIKAKLISPSGTEITGMNVEVDWIFNLFNSMIIPPEEVEFNSATGFNDLLKNQTICNFDIADIYNPDAFNNQITCHIRFNGKDYYKDTNLFFRKIGENGTNGTDVVVQITPVSNNSVLDNQALTLYTFNDGDDIKGFLNDKYHFNKDLAETSLQLTGVEDSGVRINVYRKGELLTSDKYNSYWTLAGNPSETSISKGKNFDLNNRELIWNSNKNNYINSYNLQIIKNHIIDKDTNNEYYGYYPLPIIHYNTKADLSSYAENRIAIDKKSYLKEVTYNADGRNPIYNHNQGLKLLNLPKDKELIFIAKGGWNVAEDDPDFSLVYQYQDENDMTVTVNDTIITTNSNNFDMIYILPNDSCGGSKTNNRIEVTIKDQATEYIYTTISVPIIFTLNTFGLASLNAWDGNSITIDENDGYIMSPQIGAGEKDSDNRFTGIVMGKTETYTGGSDNEKQIGLFGYSNGLQSIFLDAETGNATFGLPDVEYKEEDQKYYYKNTTRETDSDNYKEGRIELRPGGISNIGGWHIGRKGLYYTEDGTLGNKNGADSPDYVLNQKGEITKDTNNLYGGHHDKDIPHDKGGILLYGGENPYISIKSKPLEQDQISEEDDSLLKVNDSLELQLDPNTPTLFTIFRHNGLPRYHDENKSHEDVDNILYEADTRTFLAGINHKGEFVANSIGNKSTTYLPIENEEGAVAGTQISNIASKFYFNTFSAFKDYIIMDPSEKVIFTPYHLGFRMEANNKVLGQFFTYLPDILNKDKIPTLYISGGNEFTNEKDPEKYSQGEYLKNISMHGKEIGLYAPPETTMDLRGAKTTNSHILINQSYGELMAGTKYNQFLLANNQNSKLATTQNFDINIGKYIETHFEEDYLNIGEDEWVLLSNFNNEFYYYFKDFNDISFYVLTDMASIWVSENEPYIKDGDNFSQINLLKTYYKDNLNNKIAFENYESIFYKYLNENKYISEDFLAANTYEQDSDLNYIYANFDKNSENFNNLYFPNEKQNVSSLFKKDINNDFWYVSENNINDIGNIYNDQAEERADNVEYFLYQLYRYIPSFDTNTIQYNKATENNIDYYAWLDNQNAYYYYTEDDYSDYIPISVLENALYYKKDTSYRLIDKVNFASGNNWQYQEGTNDNIQGIGKYNEDGELIEWQTNYSNDDNANPKWKTIIYDTNSEEYVPKYYDYLVGYDEEGNPLSPSEMVEEISEYNLLEEEDSGNIIKYIQYKNKYLNLDNFMSEGYLGEKSIFYKTTIENKFINKNNFILEDKYYQYNNNENIEYLNSSQFEKNSESNEFLIYVKLQSGEYILLSDYNETSYICLQGENLISLIDKIYLKDIDIIQKYRYDTENQIYIADNTGDYYKTNLSIYSIFFDFYKIINTLNINKEYVQCLTPGNQTIYIEQPKLNELQWYYLLEEREIKLDIQNLYYPVPDRQNITHYITQQQWNNRENNRYVIDGNDNAYLAIEGETIFRQGTEAIFPNKDITLRANKMLLEIGTVKNDQNKFLFNLSVFDQTDNNSVPTIKIQNYNMPIHINSYHRQFDFRIFDNNQVGWIGINPKTTAKIDSSDIIGIFTSSFVTENQEENIFDNGLIITKNNTYLKHINNIKLISNKTTSITTNTTGVGSGYSAANPQLVMRAGTSNRWASLILNSSSNGWSGFTNGNNWQNYPIFAIKTSLGNKIGLYPQNSNTNPSVYSEVFYVNANQVNSGTLKLLNTESLTFNDNSTLEGKLSNLNQKINNLQTAISNVASSIPSLSEYATQSWVNQRIANHNHNDKYAKIKHDHSIRYTTTTINIDGIKSRRVVQTVGNGGSEIGYTSATYNK